MYSRHDLVWLTARGWDAALARALPGQHEGIEQWKREGWPVVVRRDEAGAASGAVNLGLAMPPADGVKRRIALQALEEDVAKTAPPFALRDAAQAAPARWRDALDELTRSGIPLRAFGSLALQAITGQTYLTAKSDIDLLFYPRTRSMLGEGLALFAGSSLPLDGEIVFPSGDAVAWKEWAGTERVLVKQSAAIRLAPVAQLLAMLEDA